MHIYIHIHIHVYVYVCAYIKHKNTSASRTSSRSPRTRSSFPATTGTATVSSAHLPSSSCGRYVYMCANARAHENLSGLQQAATSAYPYASQPSVSTQATSCLSICITNNHLGQPSGTPNPTRAMAEDTCTPAAVFGGGSRQCPGRLILRLPSLPVHRARDAQLAASYRRARGCVL